MTKLNNLVIFLGRLLFAPFTISPRLYLRVKDLIFSNPAEHLIRFARLSEESQYDFESNIIIDVGAADGLTACFLFKNIKNSRVIAFEPNELMWKSLEKNVRGKDIEVRKLGLGDKSGWQELHVTNNRVSSSVLELNAKEIKNLPAEHQKYLRTETTRMIEMSTLDDQTRSLANIFCIKLDVQGYELQILRGGTATLKRTNYLIVEMGNHQLYAGSSSYYEVDEFLRQSGFKLADIVVSFRTKKRVQEYDAIYERTDHNSG